MGFFCPRNSCKILKDKIFRFPYFVKSQKLVDIIAFTSAFSTAHNTPERDFQKMQIHRHNAVLLSDNSLLKQMSILIQTLRTNFAFLIAEKNRVLRSYVKKSIFAQNFFLLKNC